MTRNKAPLHHVNRVVLHLKKRRNRIVWSVLFGLAFLALWLKFDREVFKFFSDATIVPVMDALLESGGE